MRTSKLRLRALGNPRRSAAETTISSWRSMIATSTVHPGTCHALFPLGTNGSELSSRRQHQTRKPPAPQLGGWAPQLGGWRAAYHGLWSGATSALSNRLRAVGTRLMSERNSGISNASGAAMSAASSLLISESGLGALRAGLLGSSASRWRLQLIMVSSSFHPAWSCWSRNSTTPWRACEFVRSAEWGYQYITPDKALCVYACIYGRE